MITLQTNIVKKLITQYLKACILDTIHYAKYRKFMVAFTLSEAFMNIVEEPNEKIKKKHEEPEKASAVNGSRKDCLLNQKTFWDKYTWTEYKERAINHTFQHEFKTKPSLIYSKTPDKPMLKAQVLVYTNLINQYLKKRTLQRLQTSWVEPLSPKDCDLYSFHVEDYFLKT